ncbi:MAG: hypothetical protein WA057_06270 [Candidatus Magasanikiibacteriota bacterium]
MKKIFFVLINFLLVVPVLAQGNLGTAGENLKTVAGGGGAGFEVNNTFGNVVGNVINVALTLVGLIFLVLTVYAGYLWMTARGEEEQVKKAQKIVTESVIGLVLVLGAYAITYLVTTKLGQ